MKYYSFSYLLHENGYIIKSTDKLYYTGTGREFDQMRKLVRLTLNNPVAIVTIKDIEEVSNYEYEFIKANQPQVIASI